MPGLAQGISIERSIPPRAVDGDIHPSIPEAFQEALDGCFPSRPIRPGCTFEECERFCINAAFYRAYFSQAASLSHRANHVLLLPIPCDYQLEESPIVGGHTDRYSSSCFGPERTGEDRLPGISVRVRTPFDAAPSTGRRTRTEMPGKRSSPVLSGPKQLNP